MGVQKGVKRKMSLLQYRRFWRKRGTDTTQAPSLRRTFKSFTIACHGASFSKVYLLVEFLKAGHAQLCACIGVRSYVYAWESLSHVH